MTSLALQSLVSRKLRTALTAVAIVLGVAMIAGTYVQTDQIRTAFNEIEQTANAGVDVRIAPKTAFTGNFAADEPTGNLDSRTGAEILGLLRDMVDSLGQTTVMVTHDPQAAAIADRVLFLDDGHIVRDLGTCSAHEILATMDELAAA